MVLTERLCASAEQLIVAFLELRQRFQNLYRKPVAVPVRTPPMAGPPAQDKKNRALLGQHGAAC